MGLDMYLSKKTYVKQWSHNEKNNAVTVKFDGKVRKDIKPKRISHIVEEVGYWRKANHIHNWFVTEVQEGRDECQESWVSIDQLKELRDLCKVVVEKKDEEFSKEHLPAKSGFFFGGTEYDEYYYSDCEDTIKFIDGIIEDEGKNPEGAYGGDFYYQASW